MNPVGAAREMSGAEWIRRLAEDGIARISHVLTPPEIEALLEAIDAAPVSDSVRQKGGTYAIRNLFDVVPEATHLSASPKIRRIVEAVLGSNAIPVRGILFDKTPGANWKVPLHQDLTIAVERREDLPGFGPWSLKSGVLHVQPPTAVLEKMLSIRLYLDACDASNGPLRVIRGSHTAGRLTNSAMQTLRESHGLTSCVVGAGDALVMRPLLAHSSGPSRRPGHRRVIHLDFAAGPLPGGLEWAAHALSDDRERVTRRQGDERVIL
jgi:hypothetical protein